MHDLIERQAAIDAINELHDKPNAWLDCAVEAVEALPSAQPEIIRCKDCKHWTVGQKGKPWQFKKRYCNRSVTMCVNENDFCSMAEMRVNDESN